MEKLKSLILIVTVLSLMYLFSKIPLCLTGQSSFIKTEHPNVTYLDTAYFKDVTFTSKRFGRRNQIYFVNLTFTITIPIDNNIKLDFYFYEFLSNEYKRGFIEMHFKMCDLINKDPFFGASMKQSILAGLPPEKRDVACPLPKGRISFENMSIPVEAIPPGFPFTKGRIYCNLSLISIGHQIASGYIDMELVEIKNNQRKRKNMQQ